MVNLVFHKVIHSSAFISQSAARAHPILHFTARSRATRLSLPALSLGKMALSFFVGYQNVAIADQQFSLFAPTFKGVGGELDLTSIQIVTEDGSVAESFGVVIQTMDENNAFDGETCGNYYWTEDEGWVDGSTDDPIKAGTVMFSTGNAFLVGNNVGEGIFFRVSGEVDLINKNIVPNQPFSLIGNSTPVPFDLTAVTLTMEDGSVAESYSAVLQTMDENNAFDGETCANYYWTEDEGWMDGSTDEAVKPGDVMVNPGDAFLVGNNADAPLVFNFPCPVK